MDGRIDEYESDADDGPLDPAIQIELERLNRCGEEINSLESEYTTMKRETESLREKVKKELCDLDAVIGRTRLVQAQPYYESLRDKKRIEADLLRYERNLLNIKDELDAAREMLTRTEEELVAEGINDELREMHEQAARKLETVVERKADIEQQISQARSKLGDRAAKARVVQRQHPRAVARSKVYFEVLEAFFEENARRSEALRSSSSRIQSLKREYADALRHLEAISLRIHNERERNRANRRQSVSASASRHADNLSGVNLDKRPSISLVQVAEQLSKTASTGAEFSAETVGRIIAEQQQQQQDLLSQTVGGTGDEVDSALVDSTLSDSAHFEAGDALDLVRDRLARMNMNLVHVDVDVDSAAEFDTEDTASTSRGSFGDLVGYHPKSASSSSAVDADRLTSFSASVDVQVESDSELSSIITRTRSSATTDDLLKPAVHRAAFTLSRPSKSSESPSSSADSGASPSNSSSK